MRIRPAIKNIINHIKDRGGFSLVEVLVAVLIFAILSAAVSAVLLVGDASWQTNSVQVELQQELRKAMDWMKDELRQSGPVAISDGPTYPDGEWYPSITFQKANGISAEGRIVWGSGDSDATTQFLLGGTDNNQLQKIERDDDGNIASTKVLAQNIQAVQFRRQSGALDIIEVELDAQKDTVKGNTITESLDFDVQMRN